MAPHPFNWRWASSMYRQWKYKDEFRRSLPWWESREQEPWKAGWWLAVWLGAWEWSSWCSLGEAEKAYMMWHSSGKMSGTWQARFTLEERWCCSEGRESKDPDCWPWDSTVYAGSYSNSFVKTGTESVRQGGVICDERNECILIINCLCPIIMGNFLLLTYLHFRNWMWEISGKCSFSIIWHFLLGALSLQFSHELRVELTCPSWICVWWPQGEYPAGSEVVASGAGLHWPPHGPEQDTSQCHSPFLRKDFVGNKQLPLSILKTLCSREGEEEFLMC